MPIPYNFNNSSLNSRRNRSWFARYRVLVVFGVVALITLIIVLFITDCGGNDAAPQQETTTQEESSSDAATAPAGEENRNSGAPATSGTPGAAAVNNADPAENADWYKNEIVYVVKSGDMLRHIARRHHASERGIIKLNSMSNPNNIRIGQKLRIIPGPWRITIDTAGKIMTILQNEKIYMRCQVVCSAKAGDYKMVWRQQHTDSAKRKKGSYYLLLLNKSRRSTAVELKDSVIQKLLYLLPGGIPVTVSDNK